MSAPEITVIDYGVGNLLSVRRGLEHCGARVTVTADPEVVKSSAKVVLPGVGAFADCRAGLDAVPGMRNRVMAFIEQRARVPGFIASAGTGGH